MTQYISESLANAFATLFASTFADGEFAYYAGNPNSGGTLLASGKLPMAPFGAASGGVVALAGQWFATITETGTHTISHVQFQNADVSDYYIATAGVSGSGMQVILSDTSATYGDVVSISAFTYTVPES